MDHVVAGFEVQALGCEERDMRPLPDRERLFGDLEQVAVAEERQLGVGQQRALWHRALHDVDAGQAGGHEGAVGQIVGRGVIHVHAHLVRQGILAEDVGEPLDLALRGDEEDDAPAGGNERAGLFHRRFHVVAKRRGRPRGDLQGLVSLMQPGAFEREFAQFQFAALRMARGELAPMEKDLLGRAIGLGRELIQSLPEPVGGLLERLRFIPDHDCVGRQVFQRALQWSN